MSAGGTLRIVGLGPGHAYWITPEVANAIAAADDFIGYAPYLARLAPRPDQRVHASDNRVELDRARHALTLTAAGRHVVVVSGGDPGIFAMAAAVFEAVDHGDPSWRLLDIAVCPGISAMQAAAARLGAPLGHDFCAISLSDNLKPWPLVAKRLRAAAEGDFVIALYNPASKARPRPDLLGVRPAARRQARRHTCRFRAIHRPARRKNDSDEPVGGRSGQRRHEHARSHRVERDTADPASRCATFRLHAAQRETRLMGRDRRHHRLVYTPRGARPA